MDAVEPVIWLHPDHWEQMRAEVDARAPEEACGLVAGKEGRSRQVFPVENILHSPVRYRMDPQQQVDRLFLLEAQALDLLAIYHSHPQGPPGPSPTDVAEAAYPEAVWLIWFRADGEWACRGYSIQERQVSDVKVIVGVPGS